MLGGFCEPCVLVWFIMFVVSLVVRLLFGLGAGLPLPPLLLFECFCRLSVFFVSGCLPAACGVYVVVMCTGLLR